MTSEQAASAADYAKDDGTSGNEVLASAVYAPRYPKPAHPAHSSQTWRGMDTSGVADVGIHLSSS